MATSWAASVQDLASYDWRDALAVVRPETLICWHRAGWKLYCRLKSRPLMSAGWVNRQITLVPLDATYSAALSLNDCQRLESAATPASLAAANIIRTRIENYDRLQPIGGGGVAPVHDALAVASVIQPDILHVRFLHVEVETKGELTLGRTVMDTASAGPIEARYRIAT
jgi:inosine-uridine nucleoside N-ribohydrolase